MYYLWRWSGNILGFRVGLVVVVINNHISIQSAPLVGLHLVLKIVINFHLGGIVEGVLVKVGFAHKQPGTAVGAGGPFVRVKVRHGIEPLFATKCRLEGPADHAIIATIAIEKRHDFLVEPVRDNRVGVEEQQHVMAGLAGAVVHLRATARRGARMAHNALVHHQHQWRGGIVAAPVNDNDFNVLHNVCLFKDAFDAFHNVGFLIQDRYNDG